MSSTSSNGSAGSGSLRSAGSAGSTTGKILVLHAQEVTAENHLTDGVFRELLRQMRNAHEMCDVTLVVEGGEIAAHKLVLASCSGYFRGMFRAGGFGESQSSRIAIDPKGDLGIKAEAVEQLIQYIYSGQVQISHLNVIDLIRAADLFGLSAVKNQTLKVIEEHITFDTYLDIREVGSVFNCPRLIEAVEKFIRYHFAQFVDTQAFVELEKEDLVKFLSHGRLRTVTEEIVLEAMLRWCRHNDRLGLFPELSQHIRFELISTKYLLRVLKETEVPVVSSTLLDKMQNLKELSMASRPRYSSVVLVAMPYRTRSFFLINFYGDHIEFTVKDFPSLIHEHVDALMHYSVSPVGNTHLYFAGGSGYTQHNEPFHCENGFLYDLVEDTWEASSPLPGLSFSFGMASLGRQIYIVGGEGQQNTAATDEIFRMDFDLPPSDREWVPVSKMTYTRSSVALIALENKIYALGGMLDGGYTSTVEMYDPEVDAWIEVDPMTQARCNPGYAVANGKLYVVGGLGDNLLAPPGPGALKTAEVYDPDSDSWSTLPDMYFSRHSPAVAFVNNKLFVFGGGSPSPLLRPGPERTIECFDFDRHEWFVLQAKIPGRSNAIYVSAFFSQIYS
ncbi:hypothetical protein TCAL_04599 [Tigriopus californicus]|uniref:Kelch-like protein diablo n=1 Tax=Tigriopus californicus TaxID=6832 RepID=A0A553PA67_TIGCA|nr:kelch-like protein diablo [Tigriopus californicus]TRY74577.1 hypothetical protein TCAL_04599 [Tigriopus californicus]|eukprot:TCALIF_04599-PA protein Name:"Similar to KLHL3 Kelch-like protein 3 (Homo sapiens)" AED:0.09 eAED:0.09 QI:0/-1/0/1/-1/1/1/0/615